MVNQNFHMFKTLTPALAWTVGMFAFLACIFSFSQGFGGTIASAFFLASGLALFPPTSLWLRPRLESVYRRQVSQSALVTSAIFLLLVGVLAVPVERNLEDNNQAFASEPQMSQQSGQSLEKTEENQETVPLVNELLRQSPKVVGEMLSSE